uniref:Immunoglobulin domain-containing protein n=1 Tax=Chelydra serpentina TaxID=8475 RepID=A0A8C3SMU8_CHESE
MASALTVLLGEYQRQPGPGREFLKPTIWVSPSRVVALGGSVTIRCEGRYRSMKFFLRKAGHPNPQVQTVPDGTVAEFPIPSVGREDGGSYTCDYHSIAEQNRWSYPSDPVEIIVGEPSYPKPNISLSPRSDVTIRCQGQRWDVRFFLHEAGDLNPQRHMDPAGAGAEFRIPTVGRQHGGSYSCSYRPRSEPFVSSLPSDPVQLVVAGEGPGSASPLPAHTWLNSPGVSAPLGRSEPGSALSASSGQIASNRATTAQGWGVLPPLRQTKPARQRGLWFYPTDTPVSQYPHQCHSLWGQMVMKTNAPVKEKGPPDPNGPSPQIQVNIQIGSYQQITLLPIL